MALKNDNIKDLFSSKLNSFEPEVPASAWAGIDQLLSQQPAIQTPDASQASTAAKSTSALKVTLIAAGIAASIALGVFFAYDGSDVAVPELVEESVIEKTIAEPITKDTETHESVQYLAQADVVKSRTSRKHHQSIAEKVDDTEVEITTEGTEELESLEVKVEEIITKSSTLDELEELPLAPLISKFLTEDMSFSLRTNAGALSSDVNNNGGDLLFSRDTRSSEFADLLRDENEDYELTHKQPISVGMTVSKRISRRFSVETGLMFTYLSSKVTSNSVTNIKEEQVFGYLGVPLYLNYDFYELGKAKFYLSLGVMMQKDVYGKYTSKLIDVKSNGAALTDDFPSHVLYSEPSFIKKNISQSHWQFSSHLNVGVAYPIYRRMYIYTSIGGAYYFDAGNEYRTVYSDREFQLDLNLGLKFDF